MARTCVRHDMPRALASGFHPYHTDEPYTRLNKLIADLARCTLVHLWTISDVEHLKGAMSPIEPRHEKPNILVSDLVRHKPDCTATEDG